MSKQQIRRGKLLEQIHKILPKSFLKTVPGYKTQFLPQRYFMERYRKLINSKKILK